MKNTLKAGKIIPPVGKKLPGRGPARGNIILVGGHEDKHGDCAILEELARRAGRGKLIVSTVASEEPQAQWEEYRRVFRGLGVKRVEHFHLRDREELEGDPRHDLFDGANVLFFAGGDQLKITAKIGGTPFCESLRRMYHEGGTIAGTSSGASVMGETMLIAGPGGVSPDPDGIGHMAPGLGLLADVIIDQHFAERGRIGRLAGSVALNPRLLGLGLDEDTAVVFGHSSFTVVGSGAVYVVDGQDVGHSGVAEAQKREKISIFGLRLHLLTQADKFLLTERRPVAVPQDRVGRELRKRRPKKRTKKAGKSKKPA